MTRPSLVALGLGLTLAGCANVYDVRSGGNKGIPFFPLEAVDTVTAVYEQRWYEVDLTTTWKLPPAPAAAGKNAKPPAPAPERGTFTTTLLRFTPSNAAARAVASGFGMATSPTGAYDIAFGKMRDYQKNELQLAEPEPPPSIDEIRKLPLARLERRREHVPTARPLYLNSTVPFGGKNDATIELSEKGTLTKVSANIEDQLPGSVLSLLGTVAGSEAAKVAMSKAVGAAESLQGETKNVLTAVALRLTPVRRLFTLTILRGAADEQDCVLSSASDPVARNAACRVSFSVEVQRVTPDEPAREKADQKDGAISFSGAIKLPSTTPPGGKPDAKSGSDEGKK